MATPEIPITPVAESKAQLNWYDRAKLGAAVLAFGFQQSPGNEAARAYIGTNVLSETHNPLLVGASVGLATVIIEGASSLPVADALNNHTERISRFKDKFRRKQDIETQDNKANKVSDTALALGVGSAALVIKRHLQEEDRTMQKDRSTIARTAGGIATFSAGIATLAAGGIEYADKVGLGGASDVAVDVASSWKTYVGLFAAAQIYNGVKRGSQKIIKRKAVGQHEFGSGYTTDPEQIQKALELEQRVWFEEGFGSLESYKKYENQSRVFTAFRGQKCIGVTRLFAGYPELPPFIAEMPIENQDLKAKLMEDAATGKLEELGTIAVDKEAAKEIGAKRLQVALDLWRLEYRDSYSRGIETWGIIMEPKRVEVMNKKLGFTFRQISPAIDYQGGDCAAHIMDLEEVRGHMKKVNPGLYNWFVNEPLE